ncbi:MAG: hypothetical protein HY044_00435 [Candidatus Woesebacteria bacterium]|nr:MAG: hypothetical protein HY044_00435 [Candidatus Woesebacteria bacterium]
MALKREVFVHIISFLLFFFFISLIKKWINLSYYSFWIGGLVGTMLPDIDHILYVYLMRPYELTSQRVTYEVNKRDFLRAFALLSESRSERTNLVFHNFLFQIIFFILTFFVLSSSMNLLGRGIVIGFSLHLLIDQFIDLVTIDTINHWFTKFRFNLDRGQAALYLVIGTILVFGLSVIF